MSRDACGSGRGPGLSAGADAGLTIEIVSDLIDTAISMLKRAYVPYSKHAVGSALLCKDGRIYTGCNIENAAFGPTNCAERTAFFKAVSEGERDFIAIAVVCAKDGEAPKGVWPCGVCRQVMREFCDPESFYVISGTSAESCMILRLSELLPHSFGPENLARELR